MFASKILLVLFCVLCSSHIQYTHGVIEEITKYRIIDETGYHEGEHSFNEGVLVYAICNADDRNITTCKVTHQKYPFDEISYSCRLTLDNILYPYDMEVSALGKDKAILYWMTKDESDSANVNIGTIDLQTCKINSLQIPSDSWPFILFMDIAYINNFVMYDDDSFDIFYQDPHYHPENGALYKIQIDGSGKIKSEPKIANTKLGRYYGVMTVATRSPSKGYIYIMRNQMDFSRNPKYYLWLVRPDGLSKQLAEYYRLFGDVSAGNGLIGLCSKSEADSDITCTQYDEIGDIKFSSILPNTQNVDFMKLYNLPEGGLLVMYGERKCDLDYGCQKTTKYEVTKINSDGKKTGSMRSQFDIISHQAERAFIYMNEEQGYCTTVHIRTASIERSNGEVPANATIVSKCFTDDDLSPELNSLIINKLSAKQI